MKMNSPHAREISEKAAEAVLKDTGLKVYTIGYGIGEIPPVTASEDLFLLTSVPSWSVLVYCEDIKTLHTSEVKFPAEALKFSERYFREPVYGPNCEDDLPPPSIQLC